MKFLSPISALKTKGAIRIFRKQSLYRSFRLLPIVAFVALLMLGTRTDQLAQGITQWMGSVEVSRSYAQTDDPPSPPPPSPDDPSTDEQDGTPPPGDTPSQNTPNPLSQRQESEFSQAEVETLKTLAARRKKLETREKEIDTREGLLLIAEERIDTKVAELTLLEEKIQSLIIQYDEQEKARLDSLVEIYQNMKPQDAARIFDELDIDILLDVIVLMQERRVAPILAEMVPSKAEEITSKIASQSFIPRDERTLGAVLKQQARQDPPP